MDGHYLKKISSMMCENDSMIHVVHVLRSLDVGGLENGVVNISNGLDLNRFKTTICCLNSLGELVHRVSNPNVRYISLNEKEGKRPGLFLKLRKIFTEIDPDVVHTHNYYSGLYGILGAKTIKKTKIVHGEHGNHELSSPFKRKFIKHLYSMADKVLTVSNDLRKDFIKLGIPESKIKSILNGVDVNRFKPLDSESITKNRLLSGIPESCILFGYVGRISIEKGVDRLIRAFASVNKYNFNARLMIVGDGPTCEDMKRLSADLGIREAVHFMGSRERVEDLYSIIDIFVLPSLFEGLSNVILEAMATRLAVIASDVGGNREIILPGKNGLIVPADNVDELIRSMKLLVDKEDYRSELANNAFKKVLSEFSIERMYKEYENFYLELLRR
jgi:sugar transferase (PEP-CTERM/EpsH1 system associated)